jgi:putative photosynthetic complex assembly protein
MNPAASRPLAGHRPGAAPAPDSFPRWVLWSAGGLIAFSLVSVGLVQITGNAPRHQVAKGAVERELRFEDRPDGGIAVIDGRTGQPVAALHGEQGFVRGALRALARERRSRDLGSELPFQLVAHADGRLTLVDPATGKRVDLESFGPTNAGEFARLLPNPDAPAASN